MNSMQARVLHQFNGPLEDTTLPIPVPQAGEVLVQVAASGLNPLDVKIRAGNAAHARHPLPLVLGIDLAGTVVAIGAGVTAFQPGDAVYGMTGGVGGIPGSLAQYAAVDATLLAKKPGNLSMRQAAALPLAWITAYSGLVDRSHVQPGQKVLIQGGAGGVGHLAVQLARAVGAEVFATARTGDAEFVRQLGATAIDFTTDTVEQYVARHTAGLGFDVVFDSVGGATLDASFNAVRHGGHVVSALGWGNHLLAPLSFREASYSGIFTLHPLLTGHNRAHHGDMLQYATTLAEAGKLLPRLDERRFSLHTVEAAYELLATGAAKGKLVVEIA